MTALADQPLIFLHGNAGKKLTEEHKLKISIAQRGSKGHRWKGHDVSYKGLHKWLRENLVMPENCDMCGMKKNLDLANRTGRYNRDPYNWYWLCRRCHILLQWHKRKRIS